MEKTELVILSLGLSKSNRSKFYFNHLKNALFTVDFGKTFGQPFYFITKS